MSPLNVGSILRHCADGSIITAQTVVPCSPSSHESLDQAGEEERAVSTGKRGTASSNLALQHFNLFQIIGTQNKSTVGSVKKKDFISAMNVVKKELVSIDQVLDVIWWLLQK